jgi:hypothetical protein
MHFFLYVINFIVFLILLKVLHWLKNNLDYEMIYYAVILTIPFNLILFCSTYQDIYKVLPVLIIFSGILILTLPPLLLKLSIHNINYKTPIPKALSIICLLVSSAIIFFLLACMLFGYLFRDLSI